MAEYDVILADPPWKYRVFDNVQGKTGKAVGAARAWYETMTIPQLLKLPIADLTAKNAALFMWITNPLLDEAVALMKAWGFAYKTVAFVWVKTYPDGRPICGLGHYSRSATEQCLLGIKGSMPRDDNNVNQVIFDIVRGHSAKPLETYTRIERLYQNRRYLELFARHPRPGWDLWGNQVHSTAEVAATLESPH